MFCLGGIACDDDGEMFSLMVKTIFFFIIKINLSFTFSSANNIMLLSKETFLLSINKLLPALMLLSLRENQSSLEVLTNINIY